MEHLPFRQLSAYHVFIIIGNDLMNDRMLDALGLQHHPTPLVLTSGTSRYLRHQLESPFIGTEIRIIQHRIGIQYTYNTDMIEIQSFRNHLRTNQYIRLSLFEIRNNLFISRAGACGIQVHSCHCRFGKKNFNVIFNLFRTKATVHQFRTFAGRTGFRQLVGITAIMTG